MIYEARWPEVSLSIQKKQDKRKTQVVTPLNPSNKTLSNQEKAHYKNAQINEYKISKRDGIDIYV